LNLKPDEFWKLTYAEFDAMCKARKRTNKHRANELMSLAWHTAAFTRANKLPSLKTILQDEYKEKRKQTVEEMISVVKLLNAAHGGIEVHV
jgi:hypothetical protein